MATQVSLPIRSGYIDDLGIVELIQLQVASGNTSCSVVFRTPRKLSPFISAIADYTSANIYVTNLTPQGVTVNFANPGGNQNIYLWIVG